MKNVYICHPYTALPEENLAKVRRIVSLVAQAHINRMVKLDASNKTNYPQDYLEEDLVCPVSPMLSFPEFMSETQGVKREHAMAFCFSLLRGCDELWVCSDEISAGMKSEIAFASRLKIPVFFMESYFDENSTYWLLDR